MNSRNNQRLRTHSVKCPSRSRKDLLTAPPERRSIQRRSLHIDRTFGQYGATPAVPLLRFSRLVDDFFEQQVPLIVENRTVIPEQHFSPYKYTAYNIVIQIPGAALDAIRSSRTPCNAAIMGYRRCRTPESMGIQETSRYTLDNGVIGPRPNLAESRPEISGDTWTPFYAAILADIGHRTRPSDAGDPADNRGELLWIFRRLYLWRILCIAILVSNECYSATFCDV